MWDEKESHHIFRFLTGQPLYSYVTGYTGGLITLDKIDKDLHLKGTIRQRLDQRALVDVEADG